MTPRVGLFFSPFLKFGANAVITDHHRFINLLKRTVPRSQGMIGVREGVLIGVR